MLCDAMRSLQDFASYFDRKSLGRLSFPNGVCITPHGNSFENAEFPPFFIHLHDLFRLMTDWRVNGQSVPLGEIMAIIAFGSAVRHPGETEEPVSRRKYLVFGPTVASMKTIKIQPEDADFLVITGRDLIREAVLAPISQTTYDCGTWIKKGGIHLVNRGVNQILNGVLANDSVSRSALAEGVPIFTDARFASLMERSGVRRTTPHRVFWDEDASGTLNGVIREEKGR